MWEKTAFCPKCNATRELTRACAYGVPMRAVWECNRCGHLSTNREHEAREAREARERAKQR